MRGFLKARRVASIFGTRKKMLPTLLRLNERICWWLPLATAATSPNLCKEEFLVENGQLEPTPLWRGHTMSQASWWNPGVVDLSLGNSFGISPNRDVFYLPNYWGIPIARSRKQAKRKSPSWAKKTACSDDQNQTETVSTLDFSKSLTRCLRFLNKELVHAT